MHKLIPVVALVVALALGVAKAEPSLTSGWKSQTVPPVNGRTPILYAVAGYDENTVWSAGSEGPANVALFGVVYKTDDGGKNWRVQYAPGACCEIHSLAVDAANRVAMLQTMSNAGTRILTSTDGGTSWTTYPYYGYESTTPLWGIAATQGGVWAVGTGGRIVVRAPGEYWFRDVTPSNSGATLWATAAVRDTQIGWAVGDSGTILNTTDGGATWTLQARIGSGERLSAIAAVSPQVAWVVGANGTIFKTTDGGSSWQRQSAESGVFWTGVTAITPNVAWLVAGVEGGVTHIAATFDGGQTWTTQYRDTSIVNERHLGEIYAGTLNDVWAVSTGQILRATAGGSSSWTTRIPVTVRGGALD